ncbi:MAG: hypothetical protein ABSC25_17165 [Roseiarcus sp.]|jgi:hypothetical protein
MERENDTPRQPAQELSPAEQFQLLVPLARMMIAAGASPFPDFTVVEFDATVKLMNHVAGIEPLGAHALREVIRASRPNRAQHRRTAAERGR